MHQVVELPHEKPEAVTNLFSSLKALNFPKPYDLSLNPKFSLVHQVMKLPREKPKAPLKLFYNPRTLHVSP